jgi:hypothetical protein
MCFKNHLIVLFIKLIKLFQKKPSKEIETKFLVVTTTALGDTIWATPAIRLLKQKHPEASIVVLTSIQGMQVLANNPHIEQILVLKRPLYVSLMKAYKGLKTSFCFVIELNKVSIINPFLVFPRHFSNQLHDEIGCHLIF